MRQTKEELIIEVTKLENQNARLINTDNNKRKEFAKAFKWYKQSNTFVHCDPEPIIPSWEEIFVKIGSLIDRVDEANRIKAIEDTIPGFNDRLFYLENLIKEKK